MSKENGSTDEIFSFFNEIGIISQLSSALLAKSLPDGVHPSHFSIINHLARRGDGKPPQRNAAPKQVTKNTMTHSLKVLQDRGYIDVQPDPSDGRGKLVYLTEKGHTFRKDAISRVTKAIAEIIGADQVAIMRRTKDDLAKMRKHLDDNR